MARGDLAMAGARFEAVLVQRPDHAEALHGLGVVRLQEGDLARAVALIRRAIAQEARANYYANLSFALLAGGQPEEARWAALRAVERDPAAAVARANLGAALAALDRLGEAETAFRAALQRSPRLLAAQVGLGGVLLRQNQADAAIPVLEAALAQAPAHPDALLTLGLALNAAGQREAAAERLAAALQVRPTWNEAVLALAQVETRRGRPAEAIALYRRATAAAPHQARPALDLAELLNETDAFDEAVAYYHQALAIDPDLAEAEAGLGVAHLRRGALDQAERRLDRAVAARPHWPEVRFARALVYLKQGRYAEGWPEYEWRLKLPSHGWSGEDLAQPRWDGGDLAGKTLFLHAEQGLGDAIQCARFIPELIARGARVILRAPGPLRALVKPLGVAAFVGEPEDPPQAFDLHLPLFSLPLVLGVRLPDILGADGYLAADPDRAASWAKRLPEGFRVGLVWQGSFGSRVDRGRSLRLADFAPLAAAAPGVRLISLQKGHGLEQLTSAPPGLVATDLGEAYAAGDLADTAAIMAGLDLVIACDTAAAHLAGALGRPVWIALAAVGDWRWLTAGADSPWYASARLYRQPSPGDWATPVAAMARDLSDLLAGANGPPAAT